MGKPKPELIADYRCHTGENPLWHPFENCLYWSDIPNGRLFRYFPDSGMHEQCYEGRQVGGFTIQEDGSLLLFMEKGAIALFNSGKLEYVHKEIPEDRDSRFNDVIADPMGRVFCGIMPTKNKPGHLYRLDTDGSIHRILEGTGTPNGMGFTLDYSHFYFTDSTRKTVFIFKYSLNTGALTEKHLWLKTPDDGGSPDGMTVDSQGNIWSARWNGSALFCFSAGGKELQRIDFPAKKVSSVSFGGMNLEDMYITTALTDSTRDVEGKGAGALFRLKTGAKGRPEFFSKIVAG